MRCIIVFAKEPEEGKVKTRLSALLTPRQCVMLYKAFLKDTIDTLKNVSCGLKIMAYQSGKTPAFLKKIARPFIFYRQKGKNLGERMYNAFIYAKKKRAEEIVIVGSDSPTLPTRIMEKALIKLKNNDLVLGPSLDGGFYLIGMKEPQRDIFKKVNWSSEKALTQTIGNAKRLNKKIALLKEWFDVDDPASLFLLLREVRSKKNRSIANHTKKYLLSISSLS